MFDTETFKDDDGINKIYALGFCDFYNNEPKLYYLNDYKDSNALVLACFKDLFTPKHHNFTFYTHNFGHYDVIFLLKILEDFNNYNENKYILDPIFKDKIIIKLSISFKSDKDKKITIKFVDSMNLLSASLYKLGIDFNANVLKGYFPHNFVTRDTLNYIGNTPDIKYYNDLDVLIYKEIYSNVWDLRKECLEYLKRDLLTHLDIMLKFIRYIYNNFGIQVIDCLTISRLALNIYLKNNLKDHKIPLINNFDMFSFIKKGYYGGIVEIYKPIALNCYYYDVNSLYPFVSKLPMVNNECTFIEDFTGNGLDLNNLFGFFYADVITNKGYLGLLPVIDNDGRLICPNGHFSGVWSSEELKFAKENGYKVNVKYGYNFGKDFDTFSSYVDKLYLTKANPANSTEKSISKSLLNNNTGRWGMSIDKDITAMFDNEHLNYLLSTREVFNVKNINVNKFLVTYNPQPSLTICEQHGLDFNKVNKLDLKWKFEKNNRVFNDVSIAISAMITSYARIFMNKIKLNILKNGGEIYYMDTDSLVTNVKLDDNLVGKDLGQFKLEYFVNKAYFITSKTYCLLIDNDKTIIKAKGVYNDSLTLKDFEDMYYNKCNVNAIKSHTTTSYEKGFVSIDFKNVILRYDSYEKREKIYDKKGLWVNTRPLMFNNKK